MQKLLLELLRSFAPYTDHCFFDGRLGHCQKKFLQERWSDQVKWPGAIIARGDYGSCKWQNKEKSLKASHAKDTYGAIEKKKSKKSRTTWSRSRLKPCVTRDDCPSPPLRLGYRLWNRAVFQNKIGSCRKKPRAIYREGQTKKQTKTGKTWLQTLN